MSNDRVRESPKILSGSFVTDSSEIDLPPCQFHGRMLLAHIRYIRNAIANYLNNGQYIITSQPMTKHIQAGNYFY